MRRLSLPALLILALNSHAFGDTIFNYHGSAGMAALPGPHAITSMTSDAGQSDMHYDANGDLLEVTGDMTLCQDYSVLRKPKRHSKEVRRTDGSCRGTTAVEILYTVTGEKLAVLSEGTLDVFMGNGIRITDGKARLAYAGAAEESESGELLYRAKDHLGSIVAVANRQQILQRLDYLPYGEIWYSDIDGHTDRDFNGNLKQNDLLDYNARHYHPVLGKFLQADSVIPKHDTLGFNRYAYVSNNPVNRVDPSGHSDMWARVQEAEANMCAPQCHLDNYYASPDRIGEVDQALAGPINSYLAGEASFGMYDLYVAGTGNDHLARDYGMPLWARGLSLAGALPVVPNLTRVFRGFGVKNADQLNAIARGDELIPQSFDSSEEWLAAVEKLTDAGWSLDDIAKSHRVGSSFHRGGDGYGLGLSWSTDPRVGFEFYYRRITSSHGSILVSAEVDLASDALVDMRGLRYDPMSRDFVPALGGRSSEAEVTLFSPLRNYRIEKMGTFRQNEISGDWWEETTNLNELYNRLDFVD